MALAIKQSQPGKAPIEPRPYSPAMKAHSCRVCGKSFASGCALGGHMRIHGLQKDLDIEEEEEDTFTTTDSADGSEPYSPDPGAGPPKPTYVLRTKGGYYRNHHAMFGSWNSIMTSDGDITNQFPSDIINDEGWCKSQPRHTLTEDEEVAQSLVMLSRDEGPAYPKPWVLPQLRELEPSSRSLCRVEATIAEKARLQVPLMVPPIRFRSMEKITATSIKDTKSGLLHKKLFECKSCNRVFTSHQALGGHRASHRKVKGCSSVNNSNNALLYRTDAADITYETDNSKAIVLSEHTAVHAALTIEPEKKKMKVHECTICHSLFQTGQALGGHKRSHWLIQDSNQPADRPPVTNLNHWVTIAPVFSGSTEPLNLFPALPTEPLPVQPTCSNNIFEPGLGLVMACPSDDVVVEDEVDSNNMKDNERKRKLTDDRLADLGPGDWLQVGIGSNVPA